MRRVSIAEWAARGVDRGLMGRSRWWSHGNGVRGVARIGAGRPEQVEPRVVLAAVGNSLATAEPVTLVAEQVVTRTAEIGDEGSSDADIDMFRFDVAAGQGVRFDIDALALDGGGSLGPLDATLWIFDASGSQVAMNDSGTDPETGMAGNDPAFTWTFPTAGAYYVAVTSMMVPFLDPVNGYAYSMGSGAAATGEYRLSLRAETAPQAGPTGPVAAITGLSLVTDTGTPGDGITSVPRMSGTVVANGLFAPYAQVSVDVGSDGTPEMLLYADASGQFEANLESYLTAYGPVSVSFRGMVSGMGGMSQSPWTSHTFEWVAPESVAPSIANLALVNDTGMPGDGVTSDPRVRGDLPASSNPGETVVVEIDWSNDGLVDATVSPSSMGLGSFEWDPRSAGFVFGPIALRLRALRTQTGFGVTNTGAWQGLSIQYEAAPNQTPVVTELALAQDTGMVGDLSTLDPRVTGRVAHADGTVAGLPVEVDIDGDGVADGTLTTDSAGRFTVDLAPALAGPGPVSVAFRAGETTGPSTGAYGNWSTFSFVLADPSGPLATVTELGLVEDTGVAGDGITMNGAVSGRVLLAGTPMSGLTVQYDLDGDGASDGTASSGADGRFTIALASPTIQAGPVTVRARAAAYDMSVMSLVWGNWTAFTFTYELPPVIRPVVSTCELLVDTDIPFDGRSTDPTVRGVVTHGDGIVAGLRVEIDWNEDDTADVVTFTDNGGSFVVDPRDSYTPQPGTLVARARAFEWITLEGGWVPGAWSTLSFEYVVPPLTPPTVTGLGLVEDTEVVGDGVTSDTRVRGVGQWGGVPTGGLRIEYDRGADGTIDGIAYTEAVTGAFAFHARDDEPAGPITTRVRAGTFDQRTVSWVFGEWSSFAFTYTPPPDVRPQVVTASLMVDTGVPGDGITQEPNFHGTVGFGGRDVSLLPVQFDLDGDGVPEGEVHTRGDDTGSFEIRLDPATLTPGSIPLRLRSGWFDPVAGEMEYGDWFEATFTFEEPDRTPPTVHTLALAHDTGTPGDRVTLDPRVTGTIVVAGGSTIGMPVEYRLTGATPRSGVAYASAGGTGAFSIDLAVGDLAAGAYTLEARGVRWDAIGRTYVAGEWVTFTFFVEGLTPADPGISGLALVNDTGIAGDGRTTDPRVRGLATGMFGVLATGLVEYDLNGDGTAEGQRQTDAVGGFVLDLATLSLAVVPGAKTVRFRAVEWRDSVQDWVRGAWSTFSFEYLSPLSARPVVVDLGLEVDTGITGDNSTTAPLIRGRVTGETPTVDGLPVEFDLTGDGVADGVVLTDRNGTGAFVADLSTAGMVAGPTSARFRAGRWDAESLGYLFGEWATFSFTLETPALDQESTGSPGELTADELGNGSFHGPELLPAAAGLTFTDNAAVASFVLPVGLFAEFQDRWTAPTTALAPETFTLTTDTTVTTTPTNGVPETVHTLIVTTVTRSRAIDGAGMWSTDLVVSATYTITTSRSMSGSVVDSLVQSGKYGWTLHVDGDADSALYTLSESHEDEFEHLRSTTVATTLAGSVARTTVTELLNSGKRSFLATVNGTRTLGAGGEWTAVEVFDYAAEESRGTKTDRAATDGAATTSSAVRLWSTGGSREHDTDRKFATKRTVTTAGDGSKSATDVFTSSRTVTRSFGDETKSGRGSLSPENPDGSPPSSPEDGDERTSTLAATVSVTESFGGMLESSGAGQLRVGTTVQSRTTTYSDTLNDVNRSSTFAVEPTIGGFAVTSWTMNSRLTQNRSYTTTSTTTSTINLDGSWSFSVVQTHATANLYDWSGYTSAFATGFEITSPGNSRLFDITTTNKRSGAGDYQSQQEQRFSNSSTGGQTTYATFHVTHEFAGKQDWTRNETAETHGLSQSTPPGHTTTSVGHASFEDKGNGGFKTKHRGHAEVSNGVPTSYWWSADAEQWYEGKTKQDSDDLSTTTGTIGAGNESTKVDNRTYSEVDREIDYKGKTVQNDAGNNGLTTTFLETTRSETGKATVKSERRDWSQQKTTQLGAGLTTIIRENVLDQTKTGDLTFDSKSTNSSSNATGQTVSTFLSTTLTDEQGTMTRKTGRLLSREDQRNWSFAGMPVLAERFKTTESSSDDASGTYQLRSEDSTASAPGTMSLWVTEEHDLYSESLSGTAKSASERDYTTRVVFGWNGQDSYHLTKRTETEDREGSFSSSLHTATDVVGGVRTEIDKSSRSDSGTLRWNRLNENGSGGEQREFSGSNVLSMWRRWGSYAKTTDEGTGTYTSSANDDHTTTNGVRTGWSEAKDKSSGTAKQKSEGSTGSWIRDTSKTDFVKTTETSAKREAEGDGTFAFASESRTDLSPTASKFTSDSTRLIAVSGTTKSGRTVQADIFEGPARTAATGRWNEFKSGSHRSTDGTFVYGEDAATHIVNGAVTGHTHTNVAEQGDYTTTDGSTTTIRAVSAGLNRLHTQRSLRIDQYSGRGTYVSNSVDLTDTTAQGTTTFVQKSDSDNGTLDWTLISVDSDVDNFNQSQQVYDFVNSSSYSKETGTGTVLTSSLSTIDNGKLTAKTSNATDGSGTFVTTSLHSHNTSKVGETKNGVYPITTSTLSRSERTNGTFTKFSSRTTDTVDDKSTSIDIDRRSEEGAQIWSSNSTVKVSLKGYHPSSHKITTRLSSNQTATDDGTGTFRNASDWTTESGATSMLTKHGTATRYEQGGGKRVFNGNGDFFHGDEIYQKSANSDANGTEDYSSTLDIGQAINKAGVETLWGDYDYSVLKDVKRNAATCWTDGVYNIAQPWITTNPSPGVTVQTQTWVGSGVYNTLTEKTEDYSKWHLGKNADFTTDAGVRTTSSLYELSSSLNTTNTKLTDASTPGTVRSSTSSSNLTIGNLKGVVRQHDRSEITGKVTGTESVHAARWNIDYGNSTSTTTSGDAAQPRVDTKTRVYNTWWTEDSLKVKTSTTTGETVDLGATRHGRTSEKLTETVRGPGASKDLVTESSSFDVTSESRGANNAGWYQSFGWTKSKTDSFESWSMPNASGSVEFHSVSRTNDDTKADLAGNGKKFWHKYNVSSFGESTKTTVHHGVTPGPDFTPVPVKNTEVVYKLHTEDSAVLGATSRTYRLFDLTRTTTTYMGWTSTVETKLDSTSTLALDGGSEIADSPFRETFEILAGAWEGALHGLDNIASFAEMVIASVAEGAAAAWTDFVVIAKNPWEFTKTLWNEYWASALDGRQFASLAGATVSAAEGTLGLPPGTIPITAPYGHDETFANGRMVGDYWAMANQGAFLISGAGLVGAAKCGTFASKALHTVNAVQDTIGVGMAVQHAVNGEFGVGDALSLALTLAGAPRSQCFVAGTPVAVGWEERRGVMLVGAATATASSEDRVDRWAALGIGVALVGMAVVVRRDERRAERGQGFEGGLRMSVEPQPDGEPGESRKCVAERAMALDECFQSGDVFGEERSVVARSEVDTPPSRLAMGIVRGFAACAMLLAGLGSLAYALTGSYGEVERPSVAATVPQYQDVPVARQLRTRPIETIALGQRVLAGGPDGVERLDDTEIDPSTWRRVALRLTAEDRVVDVELLRSLDWLGDRLDVRSRKVWIDLAEMGVEGDADLLEIANCPEIERGAGRVVTGRFRHTAERVLSVAIVGEREPLGVTPNHPLWSVDRNEFVPAGELRVGEQLERADGTVTTVASLASRGERIVVYNLEVDAEHVYRVGDGGVLVHNACELHHIVSRYDNAKRGFARPWAQLSQKILKRADVGLESSLNKAMVRNHKGPHPELYHQRVYERLEKAVDGMRAGSAAYKAAVRSEVEAIARELIKRPSKLSGVGL